MLQPEIGKVQEVSRSAFTVVQDENGKTWYAYEVTKRLFVTEEAMEKYKIRLQSEIDKANSFDKDAIVSGATALLEDANVVIAKKVKKTESPI